MPIPTEIEEKDGKFYSVHRREITKEDVKADIAKLDNQVEQIESKKAYLTSELKDM